MEVFLINLIFFGVWFGSGVFAAFMRLRQAGVRSDYAQFAFSHPGYGFGVVLRILGGVGSALRWYGSRNVDVAWQAVYKENGQDVRKLVYR